MRFPKGSNAAVYLAYVDRDVKISGATEDEPYILNLQAGWNLVRALYTYEGDSYDGILTAFRSLTPEEINDFEIVSAEDIDIG